MRILLASSEVHPYSKTGGLADMVGALAKALAHHGHRVGVVTPLYAGIRERFPGLRRMEMPLDIPLGVARVRGDVWTLDLAERWTIYFVDQPAYYQRAGLYQAHGTDYPDNAERFIFFSKAVAHLALHLPWKPEMAHLNDWQTGLAALLLRHQRKLPGWANGPRTCMTLHNLAYQGVLPAAQFALANLPWAYFGPDGAEYFGQMGLLKTGIVFADVLTTVSPRYAREITTPEFGCGLDGLLRHRQSALTGILNGVDYDEWKSIDNPYLGQGYTAADLSGKTVNKLALQSEFGLPVDAQVPLFGNIGRLAEQKGVDILYGALQEMLHENLQVILLGTGTPAFEQALAGLAKRFPDRLAVRIGFDEGLSHRIEAGSDFFLMPSRFEPCGLNQMYSLRYGTVPIVRAIGGLDDTVVDVTENVENANGIKFKDYSVPAFAKAMRKALALYAEPELLERFRQNGMSADFSWDRLADEYLKIYQQASRAETS